MNASGIRRVGIVGAGTMGRRIAVACILHDKETCLYDTDAAALHDAADWITQVLTAQVEGATITPEHADGAQIRLHLVRDLCDCAADVDLLLESVPENVELKRRVLESVNPYLGDDTIVASNTSSIPGSLLASALSRPQNMLNANFGHLDHMKVEIMGHSGTLPLVMDEMVTFVRDLHLIPIRVRGEIFGYATNRIWRAVKREVLFLLDAGYLTPEDVDRAWMLDWGTSIGPCGLMDKIGLDVVRDIELNYYRSSDDPRDRPPAILDAMIAEGRLGEKTGRGFFSYPDPAYKQKGWLSDL